MSASQIREAIAKSILSPTSGFLKHAGFTHSLTPARNCTYGCTYCYVPTMKIYGGLQPEDWERWGQFTTLKTNAAQLLEQSLKAGQVIYCSPLVDPYQPTERERPLMPDILEAVLEHPPAVFVVQTRGPLILRDVSLLLQVSEITKLRISVSITTDREEVRQRYEPHCEPIAQRLEMIRVLRNTGLEVYATLAPLLPCDPERLATLAIEASARDLIGDPLHVRTTKPYGATTRAAATVIADYHHEADWFAPDFQAQAVTKIIEVAGRSGLEFAVGPIGFSRLARQ